MVYNSSNDFGTEFFFIGSIGQLVIRFGSGGPMACQSIGMFNILYSARFGWWYFGVGVGSAAPRNAMQWMWKQSVRCSSTGTNRDGCLRVPTEPALAYSLKLSLANVFAYSLSRPFLTMPSSCLPFFLNLPHLSPIFPFCIDWRFNLTVFPSRSRLTIPSRTPYGLAHPALHWTVHCPWFSVICSTFRIWFSFIFLFLAAKLLVNPLLFTNISLYCTAVHLLPIFGTSFIQSRNASMYRWENCVLHVYLRYITVWRCTTVTVFMLFIAGKFGIAQVYCTTCARTAVYSSDTFKEVIINMKEAYRTWRGSWSRGVYWTKPFVYSVCKTDVDLVWRQPMM